MFVLGGVRVSSVLFWNAKKMCKCVCVRVWWKQRIHPSGCGWRNPGTTTNPVWSVFQHEAQGL